MNLSLFFLEKKKYKFEGEKEENCSFSNCFFSTYVLDTFNVRVRVRCTIFKWNHEKMKRKTVPSLSEITKKINPKLFLVN